MEFALPQRNLYGGEYEGRVGGKKKMSRVFDSTAINSTQRFANRLQSGIFPPQRKWCRLEPGTDIPIERRGEAQRALDLYNDKLFAVLKQSNFDIAMGEFLLDLSVGTAVMLVQKGDAISPINFIPVPQYLVSFEEGANGQVDNVYRNMRIKGESIQMQWKDAKIPEDLQKRISDKPTEDIDLIEATIYNIDRGDYGYYVIEEKSKSQLVYRKLKSSPWVVSRYMKVAGEIYGRGPGIDGIARHQDAEQDQRVVAQKCQPCNHWCLYSSRRWRTESSNHQDHAWSNHSCCQKWSPQGEALKPLPRAGDFNVSQIVINDLVQAIKRTLLDESLPPDNMSARSATEVVERMKELAQNLGSAFGRLINETMIPLVTKILEVMDDDGIINLPLRVNGLEVKVSPVSPLAMAQNMDEINNIIQFMQIAQGLGPEGQLAIKPGAAIDYIADKLGVPASVRSNDQERKAQMQQIQQVATQAAQAQQQGAIAAPEGMQA